MSKYTLDFNSFMNEGAKPKSGVNKILENADKRLLDTLAEIEKLELEAETEPKEEVQVEEIKEEIEDKFIYETPAVEEKEESIKYETPLPEPLQESFDGYKLFNDKSELFECNIQLQGAQIANSEARLIIESEEWNLVFKGNISSNGQCSIPIKKLSILPEGTRGKIKLEVIAEDTRFIPWEDRFLVKADKKVYVQIKEQKENKFLDKPSINVSGITHSH